MAMYCHEAKLKFLLKHILEEYTCGKGTLLSMLEDSEDPVVKTVQPTIKTGRKCKLSKLLIKPRLKKNDWANSNCPGSSVTKWYSKAEGKEEIHMVINEIRPNEDSSRIQKAAQQPQQAQWAYWDNALHRVTPPRISFLIRSVYDLLTTNTNLVRRGNKEDPTFPLCNGRQNSGHTYLADVTTGFQNRTVIPI